MILNNFQCLVLLGLHCIINILLKAGYATNKSPIVSDMLWEGFHYRRLEYNPFDNLMEKLNRR
jgi:hypothetical protein